MHGVIEVTEKGSSRKVLVKVSEIQAVFDEGMTASICIVSPRKNTYYVYVIEVEETYREVKELISKANF